jgi:hypothetical protein
MRINLHEGTMFPLFSFSFRWIIHKLFFLLFLVFNIHHPIMCLFFFIIGR